jgi:RsiW-degrading membrane proteinase PrsW (M82 family)
MTDSRLSPSERKTAYKRHSANSFPEYEAVPFSYDYNDTTVVAEEPAKNTSSGSLYFTPPVFKKTAPAVVVPEDEAKRFKSSFLLPFILSGLTVMLLLLLTLTGMLLYGIEGGLLSTVFAIIPLFAIMLVIRLIGRWNKPSFSFMLLSFLWGAGYSIAFTFIVSFLLELAGLTGLDALESSSVQAPIIEEFAKGTGILLIALFYKKYINSPLNAVIFITIIAAGFAFTENILYFGRAYIDGGNEALSQIFVARAVFSLFAHITFSLPMGYAVGYAIQHRWNWKKIIPIWVIAYVLGASMHGVWNGSATLLSESFAYFYAFIMFPVVVFAFFAVKHLRKKEALLTYTALTAYAWDGWFDLAEVEVYGTWKGRSNAKLWARKKRNPEVNARVKHVLTDVVTLAYLREYMKTSDGEQHLKDEEKKLLTSISSNNKYLAQL